MYNYLQFQTVNSITSCSVPEICFWHCCIMMNLPTIFTVEENKTYFTLKIHKQHDFITTKIFASVQETGVPFHLHKIPWPDMIRIKVGDNTGHSSCATYVSCGFSPPLHNCFSPEDNGVCAKSLMVGKLCLGFLRILQCNPILKCM